MDDDSDVADNENDEDGGMQRVMDEIQADEAPKVPAAKRITLRAHSKLFLEVEDPKAWLETALRELSALTLQTTVPLYCYGEQFDFDVIDIQPYNRTRAVHLINTDVEVEFQAPVDYVEPPRPTPVTVAEPDPLQPFGIEAPKPAGFVPFSGVGHTLTGGASIAPSAVATAPAVGGRRAPPPRKIPGFTAFSGEGRTTGPA